MLTGAASKEELRTIMQRLVQGGGRSRGIVAADMDGSSSGEDNEIKLCYVTVSHHRPDLIFQSNEQLF
jgi:hypothetical protein